MRLFRNNKLELIPRDLFCFCEILSCSDIYFFLRSFLCPTFSLRNSQPAFSRRLICCFKNLLFVVKLTKFAPIFPPSSMSPATGLRSPYPLSQTSIFLFSSAYRLYYTIPNSDAYKKLTVFSLRLSFSATIHQRCQICLRISLTPLPYGRRWCRSCTKARAPSDVQVSETLKSSTSQHGDIWWPPTTARFRGPQKIHNQTSKSSTSPR